jgi:hypothetical protein
MILCAGMTFGLIGLSHAGNKKMSLNGTYCHVDHETETRRQDSYSSTYSYYKNRRCIVIAGQSLERVKQRLYNNHSDEELSKVVTLDRGDQRYYIKSITSDLVMAGTNDVKLAFEYKKRSFKNEYVLINYVNKKEQLMKRQYELVDDPEILKTIK